MKRLITLAAAFLLLTTWILPASADVLWEPYDNSYYQTHSDDLHYLKQTYVVPENSTVNLYKSPVGGGLIKTLEAGTRVYVGPYGEINGEIWAAGYAYGDWDNEGWFRLERLQKEYGHEDFTEEYGDSFLATDDQLTRDDIDTEIYTWTYPGSGQGDGVIPADALGGGYNDGVMDFQFVYTDPDGGRWGYVGYYMGHCGWVYLDDPENPEPPIFPQTANNTVTQTGKEAHPGAASGLIWILIPALLIVTAAAIVILRKKARTTPNADQN